MTLLENSASDMSSFLPLGDTGWGTVERQTSVDVKTVDQVCAEAGVRQIDILKSDTQGFDLEVFKGAEQTISLNRVGLIYFEVIFSDMYRGAPSFSEVYDYLLARGFLLVSIYNFTYQNELASWADALFVHKSYIR